MGKYFATLFKDVRQERGLKLLLPITDPDILNNPDLRIMK